MTCSAGQRLFQGKLKAYPKRGGRVREAVAVFQCNATLFPGAWNIHDSLGEAYGTLGDRERALASYRKALELNPEAATARKKVAELEGR